jgi:SAM-dependent methyltransferase
MNERFPAGWLTVREAADHTARSETLLNLLREWCQSRKSLRIVDLGAGTGSNLRYLAPRLPLPQHWTLVDHDPDLLARVSAPDAAPPVTLSTVCADLAQWELEVAQPDLVTASALLDLVSESWLDHLVQNCVGQRAAVLLALSYDGKVRWTAPDPQDILVHRAVNAHQERDKGFGVALGPRASFEAAEQFQAAGYGVWVKSSPWELGVGALPLSEQLIAGWIAAATEQLPREAARLLDWGERRLEDLRSGRTRLRVGHRDLLALPAP